MSGSTGTAATSGIVTNGPALSSQFPAGSGTQSTGTTKGATPSSNALWLASTSGSGSSPSGSTGGVNTNGPALSSQYIGGSNSGGQGHGTNQSGTLSVSDLWLLYGSGLGTGTSSSDNTDDNSADLLMLLSQHWGGSSVYGQGHDAGEPQIDADLWTCYRQGAGASHADDSLANDPTTSIRYTGGSGGGQAGVVAMFGAGGHVFFTTGAPATDAIASELQQGPDGPATSPSSDGSSIAVITPLVYTLGSDDGPGFQLGVWASDDEGAQFVPMGGPGNQVPDVDGVSTSESEPKPRTWWQWFIGDDPIKGSLWKLGPSGVLRRGDYITSNNGKSAIESLEDAGKCSKEIIDGATRDVALAAAGAVIGFAAGSADDAVRNVGRVDHAGEHLWEAGVIVGTRCSTPFRTAVRSAAVRILEHPLDTFDHVIGGQKVKGFYGMIDGKPVVFFVAKEAKAKIGVGEVVTAIVPSPQQMKNWGLK